MIYSLKMPVFNAKHKKFGTHEIFHLFVICLLYTSCFSPLLCFCNLLKSRSIREEKNTMRLGALEAGGTKMVCAIGNANEMCIRDRPVIPHCDRRESVSFLHFRSDSGGKSFPHIFLSCSESGNRGVSDFS